MTTVWATIAGLALTTAAIKAAGPVALGGRELPSAAIGVMRVARSAGASAAISVTTIPISRRGPPPTIRSARSRPVNGTLRSDCFVGATLGIVGAGSAGSRRSVLTTRSRLNARAMSARL